MMMTMTWTRILCASRLAIVSVLLVCSMLVSHSAAQAELFLENFDNVMLEPAFDESAIPPEDDKRDAVWSPTGPTGWTVDNSQLPQGGVTEWRGWNWADPLWWTEVAGDQQRSAFTFDVGNVIAVADSDEWDDGAHAPGTYNSFLKSPPIPVGGLPSNTPLTLDMSWRAEGNQTATITASYDGGAPVEILRFESDTNSPSFQGDLNPVTDYEVPLNIPQGAQNVVLEFGYTRAANNWWWAVDNLRLGNYSEDWEGVQLGMNVNEGRVPPDFVFDVDAAWTRTGPPGWNVDDSQVPGAGDVDNDGCTEWAGWSFADREFWIAADRGQQRENFTKASGNVAVADPDEWDDCPHLPISSVDGWYATFLTTPAINLEGAEANSVELTFDSSWRPECCDDSDQLNNQTAVITVSYDGGNEIEVLRWDSDETSATFHPDNATNETITIPLNNPAGATSAVIKFGLVEAANDWWWAIDNVKVTRTGPVAPPGDFDGDGDRDVNDVNALIANIVTGPQDPARFDLTQDGKVDPADLTFWAKDAKNTWIGDANLDGEFNTGDLVQIFQLGKFETGSAAGWDAGDWNGDARFGTGDLVAAFQDGGFERGPRTGGVNVPEPAGLCPILLAAGMLMIRRRMR